MPKDIDTKVKELTKLPDRELVELARKYLQENRSLTATEFVRSTCNNFKEGDTLSRDTRTFVAIFVAFEELTRNK